jgi:hypothetical protein
LFGIGDKPAILPAAWLMQRTGIVLKIIVEQRSCCTGRQSKADETRGGAENSLFGACG